MKVKLLGRLVSAFVRKGKIPYCTAVIAAAGSSSRMAGADKIFSELGGIPTLAYSLMAFQRSERISEIIVVTKEKNIVEAADICARFNIDKATKIICGGEERIDTVLAGVSEANKKAELIAVHDGARPFVTEKIINDTVAKASSSGAAAPAVSVVDTVKIAKNGIVASTPDRSTLYAVQTPQVFSTEILKAALVNAKKKGLKVTDDCSAVEQMNVRVYLTEGSYENIKITTPTDYAVAESILDMRRDNK